MVSARSDSVRIRGSTVVRWVLQRLSGSVIHVNESTSSAKKGESLADTICCMACYCDAVGERSPEYAYMCLVGVAHGPIF